MFFHACLYVICLDLHAFMLYAMLSMLRSSLSYVFYVRSTCFYVSYHVFVPRSIFPMHCLARSTRFYGCLHVYFSCLHALCLMPCFPILCSSFCSMLMLGLHAHMLVWCCWLCLAWIYVFMYVFPCYMVRSWSSHAYMLGFMFFHVYVLGLYMLMCTFLCLLVLTYVFTCLCAWIYVLYMLYTIFHVLMCSMPCLCA